MRGRKPKPTNLRLLSGNAGKRPIRSDEPKPKVVALACPAHLAGEARKEWRRVVPELKRLGLLTTIDRAELAGYCTSWGRYVEAELQLRKFGLVVKSPQGFPVQSPYLAIANRALKDMQRFAASFGMSPSARTRVTAIRDGDEDTDPLAKFEARA